MVNPPIELGTLSMPDTLILMIIALVVFGPRRLPQIGKQIGKLMYEFRKASNDFKFQMEEELRLSEDADRRKKEEAERARILALSPPAQTIESQAAIGAQESTSAPAQPTFGSGYPEPYPPEPPPTAQDEPPPTMPRIQPPSTGAPIPAGRPGTADQGNEGTSTAAAEETVVAEANVAAEPATPVADTPVSGQAESESQRETDGTEIVSRHG